MINGKDKEKIVKSKRERILARFRERGGKARKGLFTPTTRKRLLGEVPEGKIPLKDKATWRYKNREHVKTALIDLQLFIEMGDEYSVSDTVTQESMKPIVEALLLRPLQENAKPDLKRAEIAKLFIHAGFEYLQQVKKEPAGGLYERAISDGLEICDALVDLFRPPSERFERPR